MDTSQHCEWCGKDDVPVLYYETLDPPDPDTALDAIWVCEECENEVPQGGDADSAPSGRHATKKRDMTTGSGGAAQPEGGQVFTPSGALSQDTPGADS